MLIITNTRELNYSNKLQDNIKLIVQYGGHRVQSPSTNEASSGEALYKLELCTDHLALFTSSRGRHRIFDQVIATTTASSSPSGRLVAHPSWP
jgi:hypothetical protein